MTHIAGLTEAESRQIQTVLDLLHGTIGGALLGVILHGSAVEEGLRPDSDLDLLVVTDRALTDPERRALLDGLLVASRSGRDAGPPRHLEVTVVVQADVRPWRYPPRLELQYGDWWRAEFEGGHPAPWTSPNPDLAIVLSAARSDGRALVGPPPSALFDPVPRADLERAMRAVVPELLVELDGDTRNVLLTLARIVRSLESHPSGSKDHAAEALARALEDDGAETEVVAALRRAATAYRGDAVDAWDDPRSQATAARAAAMLVARIDGTAGASDS